MEVTREVWSRKRSGGVHHERGKERTAANGEYDVDEEVCADPKTNGDGWGRKAVSVVAETQVTRLV